MKPGAPFDNCDPPAQMFWDDGRPSLSGYLLSAERYWARLCMKRHKDNPAKWSRPGYIVKLKSWKTQAAS